MPEPTVCGPYRVVERIGVGGMGAVYRALHAETGRAVALKTVLVSDDRLLAGLRREIHALSRARHPGVVEIVDQGLVDGRPWYAMELLEGRTLRDHNRALFGVLHGSELTVPGNPAALAGARAQPVAPSAAPGVIDPESLRAVLTLLRQVCEALAFLHGEGIVHRDLKPENVFIKLDGAPVLMDFGLSSRFDVGIGRDVLDVVGGVVGTVAYMAPELIRGGTIDARADLYALGCVLFECVTGRVPFVGPGVREVMAQHLHEPPPAAAELVDGIPPELDALLARLLAKYPRERLGHAGDVAAALVELGASPARGVAGAAAGSPGASIEAKDYLYRPELVGRADVMAALRSELELARGGTGRLVFLGGESGAGKTRVASELAQVAARDHVIVVTGECAPSGAPLHPLRPLLQAIADRCHGHGPDETARLLGAHVRVLAPYAPALAGLPGADAYPEPDAVSARAARTRVLTALRAALTALATEGPVLLVLDDLHWADELTLDWFAELGRGGLHSVPALVLGTHRDEEARAALADVIRAHADRAVRLGRLDAAATREMVTGMLGGGHPPDALVSFVARRSEGNAFFIAEYLRALVAEGLLRRDVDGRWLAVSPAGGELAGLPVPGSIRDLVLRRLAALSAPARAVVDAAAVLARDIDAPLITALVDLDEREQWTAIAELIARQFLVDDPSRGVLRFGHDRLREVTYDLIAPSRRAALHRAAGLAIEQRGAARDDAHLSFPLLAHHFRRAGVVDKAFHYLEQAAEQAAASGGHAAIVRLLSEAVRLDAARGRRGDGPATDLRRARWHRQLGDAHFGLGDLHASTAECTRALELLGVAQPRTRVGAAAALATRLGRQVVHRLAPSRAAADDPGARERLAEAALAAQRIAERHYYAYEAAPMISSSLLSVNLAERAGDHPRVARTYAMLGVVVGLSRLHGLAHTYFERAADNARATDDLAGAVFARYARAAYLLGSGRLHEVDAVASEALALAQRLRDPHDLGIVHTILGHLEYYRGELAASAVRYARVAHDARAAEHPQHEAWGLYARARALVDLGRTAEAIAHLEHASELLGGQGDVASEIICWGLLAAARLQRDAVPEARLAADEASRRIRQHVPTVFSAWSGYAGAAEVYLALWQREPGSRSLASEARRACRALRAFGWTFPIGGPAAHRLGGRWLWLAGRRDAARGAWQRGLRVAEELGMPLERARLHHELGFAGDAAHLAAARALFDTTGAVVPV